MSYHDGYDRPRLEGMAVVNPLIEIQRKLDKITKLVNELSTEEHENAGSISIEYVWRMQNILDGSDEEEKKVVK